MKRYTLFLVAVIGSAATAIAAIAPRQTGFERYGHNITVVEKNQAFPLVGPLVVEECQTDDCGLSPS